MKAIACNKDQGFCDAGEDGEPCAECKEIRDERMAERLATESWDDGKAQYEADMRDAGRGHLLVSTWGYR